MLQEDRIQIYVQYEHNILKKHEYSGIVITKATPKSSSKYYCFVSGSYR